MRKFTKHPSNYIATSESVEALSYTRTERPWKVIAYEDEDFQWEVDSLESSDRVGLQKFIEYCLEDDLYVLINYGRNWCEYITPDRYEECVQKYGKSQALRYATRVYDGDMSMFEEPVWDEITANTKANHTRR